MHASLMKSKDQHLVYIEGKILGSFAKDVLLTRCNQGMACRQILGFDLSYAALHLAVQLLTCAVSAQGQLLADSILKQVVSVALSTILAPFDAAWLMP